MAELRQRLGDRVLADPCVLVLSGGLRNPADIGAKAALQGNTFTIHCRRAAQTQIRAREPNALLHQNTIGARKIEFHAAVGPKAPGSRKLSIAR